MSRFIFLCLCAIITSLVCAQDTTTVQTFTWDNVSRRGLFQFPDDSTQSYRKILMYYNMRCHGARVGVGGVGCGEWDYSCNTFLTDSSRVDSNLSTIGSYVISGFNGLQFYYTSQPVNTYYKLKQKTTTFTSVISEQKATVGNGVLPVLFRNKSGAQRSQYLYTATELLGAGMVAGMLSGLEFNVVNAGNTLMHFKIRLKAVNATVLNPESPEVDGFTEVYYQDTEFKSNGIKRFQFHTPFNWDGNSSILVDISFTDFSPPGSLGFIAHDIGNTPLSIFTNQQERSTVWDGLAALTSAGKLDRIVDELTVSFWAFGTPQKQPTDGSLIEGLDQNRQRALNIHLPWSNGGIYFDCGFENGSYDRIEKPASLNDYEGQWVHWTFTKNSRLGEMKIYRNGKLWQSGTGKFKPIQITDLSIGAPSSYNGPYNGRMRELSIWNVTLDSAMINSWRNKSLTPAHPLYNNLVYYYNLQDGDGAILNDKSTDPHQLNLPVSLNRHAERGDKLLLDFSAVSNRPNITFLKGTYNGLKSDSLYVLDSIPAGPRKVTKYRVTDNDLYIDSIFYIYAALYDNVYYENGTIAESIIIDPEDYLEITNLKYFIKTPAKFELLSLVTPYGNNLDLGAGGKTFVFDVTDFAPLLRGRKMLSMELGGENQEEINLKFQFIKGIPERNVLDVSNIWPFQRGYFSEILMNSRFEARKLKLHQDAESYKLRFSITGHEQNGEFVQRNHFVNVNGSSNRKFPFTVWKECGWNPIYPQGGTWIFDRAGWCPGAPTELQQFDISDLIPINKEITVDYGLEPPQLDQANYLVSGQLISYGPYHFQHDASIEEIVRPNSGRVEFERLNPSCNKPTIIIRNAGSEMLSSLNIRYGMKNGIKETYYWNGNLPSSKTTTIELPVSNPDFWIPGPDSLYVFEVELLNPNQGNDENISNNKMATPFRKVDSYSTNLFFEFKTNNVPLDNQYRIVNSQGITVLERNNMTLNTQYRDELLLPPGCYTLYVTDASNDGLYFWFYAGNGNGFSRLMRKVNSALIPVKTFNPDFGAGYQYDFVIAQSTNTEEELTPMLISIAPNPVVDEVNIVLEAAGRGAAMISLMNSSGGVLSKQVVKDLNGRQSLNWNVEGLAAGLYFIEIRLGKKTYTRKFVKQ